MSMDSQLPLALRALSERLHFRIQGPQRVVRFDTFIVDLSDWKLSLSHQTPCIWVHSLDHLSLPPIELADEIRDAVRQQRWQNETLLVLVDGPADDLHRQLASPYSRFAVFDQSQQRAIFDAPSPTRMILDALMAQMPLSRLAPYETSRPVTGSRFFGRQSYLNKIIGHPGRNFIVVGIRRVGKSSLLREVERQLDRDDPPSDDQRRRVYIDCTVIKTPDELYREIVRLLSPRELKQLLGRASHSQRFQAQMFEYLAERHGGQITYLLDEIDKLLESLGSDMSLFEVLRRASLQHDQASNDAPARFIMAGFGYVRRASNDRTTPFYNFGETLMLGALDRVDVKHMVEDPMDYLRVKLQGRDEIVQRIYRETAGLPNLVQFYCQTLLEHLDHSPDAARTLSAESLQSVYKDAAFRDFLLQTFMANTEALERVIVFAMIKHGQEHFTLRDIDGALAKHGVQQLFDQLDEACRNLVAAGILQQGGHQFGFSVPLFPRMLEENYPLDFVFEKACAEVLAAGGE
jgi:hypothetical protein